jgi:hypothetical protein
MLAYGPIQQLPHYHEFADQSALFGIPHAADVLSNIGFAVIALWGMFRLNAIRALPDFQKSRYGYGLFLLGLLLTAFGSSFYHWAPDNMRLVWDRLPIALACAGLLAAVRSENVPTANSKRDTLWLGFAAIASIGWWYMTEQSGLDDLRPYLLLQCLPLILIPMWQAIYRAPAADRVAFVTALVLYVLAKVVEINDHQLLSTLGIVSGHTLKHLLATAAAAVLVARLVQRADKQSIEPIGKSLIRSKSISASRHI